ncbi:MAG: HD domain-containing protein [Burkholderiaceae bacterium]|nr:HD domain-containing protein [Burkholderiaceae bacterium]
MTPTSISTMPHLLALSDLRELLELRGREQYTGEPVTHLAHALQAAHLARCAGAGDPLVVATLLHDVGHLLSGLPGTPTLEGVDDHHEHMGADLLAQWFDEAVTQPIRLHVQAKRCLAARPAYQRALSEDSRRSLVLQGGPMDEAERQAFQLTPRALEAVALRRWDEAAKNPLWKAESLAHLWPVVEALRVR